MTHSYLELVYLVTALVPSDTACLANSPGRRRRTAVWISREVIVDLQIGICKQILNNLGEEREPLVVVGQLTSLSSDALKEVVHERIHNRHSFGRNTSVRVHLL